MTRAVSRSGSVRTAASVDALAGELLADEAAHMVGADAGAGAPRSSRAGQAPMAVLVGLPPTYLANERHVLEPAADLLAVQVDARPADGNKIQAIFANASPCARLCSFEMTIPKLEYLQQTFHFLRRLCACPRSRMRSRWRRPGPGTWRRRASESSGPRNRAPEERYRPALRSGSPGCR